MFACSRLPTLTCRLHSPVETDYLDLRCSDALSAHIFTDFSVLGPRNGPIKSNKKVLQLYKYSIWQMASTPKKIFNHVNHAHHWPLIINPRSSSEMEKLKPPAKMYCKHKWGVTNLTLRVYNCPSCSFGIPDSGITPVGKDPVWQTSSKWGCTCPFTGDSYILSTSPSFGRFLVTHCRDLMPMMSARPSFLLLRCQLVAGTWGTEGKCRWSQSPSQLASSVGIPSTSNHPTMAHPNESLAGYECVSIMCSVLGQF